jgi:hypothetical protein
MPSSIMGYILTLSRPFKWRIANMNRAIPISRLIKCDTEVALQLLYRRGEVDTLTFSQILQHLRRHITSPSGNKVAILPNPIPYFPAEPTYHSLQSSRDQTS